MFGNALSKYMRMTSEWWRKHYSRRLKSGKLKIWLGKELPKWLLWKTTSRAQVETISKENEEVTSAAQQSTWNAPPAYIMTSLSNKLMTVPTTEKPGWLTVYTRELKFVEKKNIVYMILLWRFCDLQKNIQNKNCVIWVESEEQRRQVTVYEAPCFFTGKQFEAFFHNMEK